MIFEQGSPIDLSTYSMKAAYSGSDLIYLGYINHKAGFDITDTTEESWLICKMTYSSGAITDRAWTRNDSGELSFNTAWDSRAAGTYT